MSDTKSRIIDAAIELFSRDGYTATSIRSIAEMVGIKPASIYNHFSSKADILEVIFAEYTTHLSENTVRADDLEQLDARAALNKMFYEFPQEEQERLGKILKIMVHEQFREATAHDHMRNVMFRGNYAYIKDILDRLVEGGKIRPINTGMYARLFMSILIAASIEVMHFGADDGCYLNWATGESILAFLFDQIVDD